MTDTPKHSVSVAGIIIDAQDRVLVIRRRDNNKWEPPGGVLELNETFDEGVRREVLEETGVTVTVDRLTGVYKNMNRGIVALVFRCSADHLNAVITSESAEVRWMSRAEVEEAMDAAYAVRVLDAFADDVRTRAHDGVGLA
ncbi:MAG TPA: NUDIX hydrolase [Actinophytocola sp.]|uniref:NUDIX hydrolase n=1 Tax=Actinophytocola sp. TaxID=1872138 RepID=UPI002DB792B2|nr:NUDIX hydrolase [Actinophytocola sp.]HEU5475824.1 NUDIX hydrolase [Actinophytocola sp.]